MERIDVDELHARLNESPAPLLVDVRTATEFASGHVAEAINIPLGAVAARADELRGKGPVHLICRSGNRSAQAASELETHGLATVNVEGGTSAWVRGGRPVKVERSWRRLMTPAIFALTLGLAPFSPEPHIVGKIRWIAGGAAGMGPMDWFDVLMHGLPWLWLLWTAIAILRTPSD